MKPNLPLLPLSQPSFRDLREQGFIYVDKTQHAYNLIKSRGRAFFLSRPRRFGKSLLVSTLGEILSGNRDVFQGLWIDTSDYEWHKHGVITLDFSTLGTLSDTGRLEQSLISALKKSALEQKLIIEFTSPDPALAIQDLILALHARHGKVAILIDEYDSPILQQLQDHEQAKAMRKILHNFFSMIKGLGGKYIKFLFITGISAFSKAGIFSGMNDVITISLQEAYADICGYTDTEIDAYFANYISAWADTNNNSYSQQRELIKQWYNGYRFSKAPITVYSPFSVMHAMGAQSLENFWFSSATPTFLVEELKKQQLATPGALEKILKNTSSIELTQASLGASEIGETDLPALMFQTGYLTIADYDKTTNSYQLGYPNREVEQSLQLHLLSIVTRQNGNATENLAIKLSKALIKKDVAAAMEAITTIFTSMPYPIHGDDEKHYHAILYMALKIAVLAAQAEFITSHGRADIILNLSHVVYLVEVKFSDAPAKKRTQTAKELAHQALAQIEERRYYEQFIREKKSIILLGIAFKRGEKSFEIEYDSKAINA